MSFDRLTDHQVIISVANLGLSLKRLEVRLHYASNKAAELYKYRYGLLKALLENSYPSVVGKHQIKCCSSGTSQDRGS